MPPGLLLFSVLPRYPHPEAAERGAVELQRCICPAMRAAVVRAELAPSLAPPRDGPITDLGSEHRHAGEYDQHPCGKASVPNESVDHGCDSSLKQFDPVKSAVLGPDGGFSFADLQHPPRVNPLSFARGR